MTSILTPSPAAPSGTPSVQPVLAVILDDPAAPAVLNRAAVAAAALAAPLTVAFLHPRDGFSTDPALVAGTARRRERWLQNVLAEAQHATGYPMVGVALAYGWRPPQSRDRLITRVVAGTARQHRARLVVVPSSLGRAVSQLAVPAVVVEAVGHAR